MSEAEFDLGQRVEAVILYLESNMTTEFSEKLRLEADNEEFALSVYFPRFGGPLSERIYCSAAFLLSRPLWGDGLSHSDPFRLDFSQRCACLLGYVVKNAPESMTAFNADLFLESKAVFNRWCQRHHLEPDSFMAEIPDNFIA